MKEKQDGLIREKNYKLSLFFFILILFLNLSGCIKKETQEYPVVKNGFIDLSSWIFDSNGSIPLNGKWEFYWKSLLTPSDFDKDKIPDKTGYINMPGLWKNTKVEETQLSETGYATYRLNVILKPNIPVALYINTPLSVCKVWVNGKLVGRSGKTGISKKNEIPEDLNVLTDQIENNGKLDIIIQISNYHNIDGGIAKPVIIGTKKYINSYVVKKLIVATLVSSVIFVFSIFHLFQYFLRRTDKANLYFGLYCLMVSISSAFGDRGINVIAQFFPNIPWNISLNIIFLPHGLATAFLVMFYHSLFPCKRSKYVERFYQISGGIFILYILLTPSNAYDKTLFIYRLILLTVIPYLFTRFIADNKKRAEGIKVLIPAYIIFFLSVINDILYDLEIIDTANLIEFSTIFLVLSYSLLIPIRLSKAYSSVKSLSLELEEKNLSLVKLNAMKDEFLANTSHELRTPLNGIIGIAESLIHGVYGNLKTQVTENLKIISSSGRRLSSLINDILDFSVVKEQKIKLNIKIVNLRSVVDTVITSTEILALEKGLEFMSDIGPLYVYADEERLQQILFNLIGNAIKFTNKGSISITAESGDSDITVSVSDTGIGICDENFSKIFESFQQIDSKSTTSHQGIGLGLSITRHLVDLHGSRIFLKSQTGKGSTFSFTLKKCAERHEITESVNQVLYTDRNIEKPIIIHPENQLFIPSGKPYILVVDDDPGNLHVVSNYLRLLEVEVITCINGVEALEVINKCGKPSLVLLDVMMPDMSGLEVCKEIRKEFNASKLPVIMLTAKSTQADIVEGFESGANDYLVKPFSGAELMARVKTNLELENNHNVIIENVKLKKEIKLRKDTESRLRFMQKHLSETLGFSNDALLAVNESMEISFCNNSFEIFSGYNSSDLLGQPFHILIQEKFHHLIIEKQKELIEISTDPMAVPPNEFVSFIIKDKSVIKRNVLFAVLYMDEGPLFIIIIPNNPNITKDRNQQFFSANFINSLNENRERLIALEESLSFLTRNNENPMINENLEAIDTNIKIMTSIISKKDAVDKRVLGLEVMILAVDLWIFTTKTSKIELADNSKLWSIYFEKDGFARTQTLDRYLNKRTFPEKPRWKNILNTADFVLAECSEPSPLKEKLEEARESLIRVI